MINEALIKITARTLRNVGDEGVTKSALATLTECDIGRKIVTEEFEDALAFLKQKGFVATQKNVFDKDVYFLTQAGKNFIAV
ncbi:MAG: hypothetical protein ACOYM3_21575 [Terrimicrobiaceae bacterium]